MNTTFQQIVVAWISICLFVWVLCTPAQVSKPFIQHDTQWSDHLRKVHTFCSYAAFVEYENATIQGGTPEQADELANGVYLECIKTNHLAI